MSSNLNELFKKKQPSPNLRTSSSRTSSSRTSSSSLPSRLPLLESEDSDLTSSSIDRRNDDGIIILMFYYFKEKLKRPTFFYILSHYEKNPYEIRQPTKYT